MEREWSLMGLLTPVDTKALVALQSPGNSL